MLRLYQATLEQEVWAGWGSGARDVLAVLPTGGGKTPVFSSIIQKTPGLCVALAHRDVLVGQMSLTLAHWGIRHTIVAQETTVREIIRLHIAAFGKSFYQPNANVVCAGVDTIIRRRETWFNRVSLWVVDEAHHLLRDNKWGEACRLFPNAKGLGVTATPLRADGKGLGRHADGVFDLMVQGPCGRELMNDGYLCEYDVYTFSPSDLDFSDVEIGSTGDLKMPQLRKATHRSSQLVGDVVKTYLRYAHGKRGITFSVDIESARELVAEFRNYGVPAELVTAETPLATRAAIIKRFRAGEVKQLVNVDLFGEGFDVPAVEVVSMARRTESYGLFAQQLGRPLRPVYAAGTDMASAAGRRLGMLMSEKPRAILLDHVGNYLAHTLRMGMPEDPKPWTLDAREKSSRGKTDQGIPMTGCVECAKPYERFRTACPYCGHEPKPAARSKPEQVDGDLQLLDLAAIRELTKEINRIDGPGPNLNFTALSSAAKQNAHNLHMARQRAQLELRTVIAQWGGYRKREGLSEREAQKKFYLTFGTDVLNAQTLGAREALELSERISHGFK